MTEPFKFEIHGLKDCMKALEQLPTLSMKKAVVRKALKKSAAPVKDVAKQNAQSIPIDGKSIADSIKIGTSLKKSQKGKTDRSRVTVYVGPSHPLGSIFEWGTAERYTKAGAYRGFIPPMPFMRQAFDSKKNVSLSLLRDELWRSLEKAAKLLAKKAERNTLTAGQRKGLR
ncbi:MAG: HK97 gp10 family phage protein [Spirochaetales bacterium]|jgi:HK97 gp10 family phage protein|nr:HK97 gp10 family phage protein [Spirochaetales bacterium]